MSSPRMSLFRDKESLPAESLSVEKDALPEVKGFVLREDGLQLATRLMAALGAEERVIVVTSCDAKDGASDLAAQLALGLARTNKEHVALVDADVRRPSLDALLNCSNTPGFAEFSEGAAELSDVSRQVDVDLFLVPAGAGSTVLSVPACLRAVAALRTRFRYVVIAAGPLLSEAGSVTLASLADGVVLSLRAGKRSRGDVEDVQRELARVRARFLGAVLRVR